MNLPIKKSEEEFIPLCLRILRNVIPQLERLRPKEIELLAILLHHNYKFRRIEEDEDRWKIILHYDNRVTIAKEMGISKDSFENNLSNLRKHGIVVDNMVVKKLHITPEKINLNFTITKA